MEGPEEMPEKILEQRAVRNGYLKRGMLDEIRQLLIKYFDHGLSKAELARFELLITTKDDVVLTMQRDG